MSRHRCARRAFAIAVGVVCVILGVTPSTSTEASGPVGNPPGPGAIVSYGHVPYQCAEGDENPFGVSSGAIYGWAWSPVSSQWRSTPVCIIKWGYVGMTSPVVAAPGAVTTFSILDESNLGGYIPALGGASWAAPGEVVAGCTFTSMQCSVRLGVVNQHPAEWQYHLVQVTTPGAFVTWIPQVGCTEATPCSYLVTHAWSFVMIPPQPQPPTASFGHDVSGAELSVVATSTDPLNIPLTHEWSFGDGTTRLGPSFSHVYRDPGTYTVGLTSTNAGGLSDSVTKQIEVEGEPLEISDLAVDPATPQGGTPASFTFTVTNHGSEPVTGITPTIGNEPSTVMRRVGDGPLETFDLAPGAFREVTVPMQARRAGEVLVSVNAGGQRGGTSTKARMRSLSIEVEASALRVTPILPDDRPRQGDEFTVTARVTNHGEAPIQDVVVTLDVDPAARVEIVSGPEPAAPIALAPEGEERDSAEVAWTLTASRTAKVDVTFRATGKADEVELESDVTETVDLDADLEFEWEIAPRFTDISQPITDPADVSPSSYEFIVRITQINRLDCTSDDTEGIIFQADGQHVQAVWAPEGTAGSTLCRYRFERDDLDPFDLEVARVVDDVIDSVGEDRIEARDFLIFSIGDSLSSGEGNPRPGSLWTLEQCHRSAMAGPSAAAWKVEQEDPHSVVTFVHLACSGASTPTGLTGSYAGIVAGPWLPPQIPEIARFAGDREVDAVVMSVGANDIEFGRVVAKCVSSRFLCFNEELDDGGIMVPVPEFVARRIGRLDYWNDRNATWLKAAGVAPERVYALTYPRVTRDHTGDFCPTLLTSIAQTAFFMSYEEWEWNELHIEYPLNAAVVTAAGRNGWRWISGFADLFERHGYCSNDTWVTSILGSIAVQHWNHAGAFHPNAPGHEVYRDKIYDALVADLYVGDRPRPLTSSGDGVPRLDGPAAAGSDVVQVRNDPFKVGDRVVVNPGTPIAETRTIVDKGSLVFDRPLAFDHPDGAMIVLEGALPGALDQVPVSSVPPATSPSTPPSTPQPPPSGTAPPPGTEPPSAPPTSGPDVVPPGDGATTTTEPGSGISELPATGGGAAALAGLALGLIAVGVVLTMQRSGGGGRQRGRGSPRGRPAR